MCEILRQNCKRLPSKWQTTLGDYCLTAPGRALTGNCELTSNAISVLVERGAKMFRDVLTGTRSSGHDLFVIDYLIIIRKTEKSPYCHHG